MKLTRTNLVPRSWIFTLFVKTKSEAIISWRNNDITEQPWFCLSYTEILIIVRFNLKLLCNFVVRGVGLQNGVTPLWFCWNSYRLYDVYCRCKPDLIPGSPKWIQTRKLSNIYERDFTRPFGIQVYLGSLITNVYELFILQMSKYPAGRYKNGNLGYNRQALR